MHQEDMANELERILEVMTELDPTSEKYTAANRNYHELLKAFHEDLAACDADLANDQQRKLNERAQQLKEKEAEYRMRQAKMDAAIGMAKIGLGGMFTLGGIVLTGTMEQSTILSAKCFSLLKSIFPKT